MFKATSLISEISSYLDSAAFIKAKINNAGVLALGMHSLHHLWDEYLYLITHAGYTQALRPGVKASFGLALDTQKLNDASPAGPSHKVFHSVCVHSIQRLLIFHRLVLVSSSRLNCFFLLAMLYIKHDG